jgi:hypothetical protein
MTASSLPTALRAGAQGIYVLEAAAGLIIAHGTWLTRDDFRDHICPARPGKAGCCSSPPAWPARPRSSSATPSPDSTTVTSRRLSGPFSTLPAAASSRPRPGRPETAASPHKPRR